MKHVILYCLIAGLNTYVYADDLLVKKECVKSLKNGEISLDLSVQYGKETLTHKASYNIINKDCSTTLKKTLMPTPKQAFYLESMIPVIEKPSKDVTQISKQGVIFAHDFNVLTETDESVVLEYSWYVKKTNANVVNTVDSFETRETKAVTLSKGDTLILGNSENTKIKLTFLGWKAP